MDLRAISWFDRALGDVGLVVEPLRQVLRDCFVWVTTTTLAGHQTRPTTSLTVSSCRAGPGTARRTDPRLSERSLPRRARPHLPLPGP